MTTEAPEKEQSQLPAWDLSDYYSSIDDERIEKDLESAEKTSQGIRREIPWQGGQPERWRNG